MEENKLLKEKVKTLEKKCNDQNEMINRENMMLLDLNKKLKQILPQMDDYFEEQKNLIKSSASRTDKKIGVLQQSESQFNTNRYNQFYTIYENQEKFELCQQRIEERLEAMDKLLSLEIEPRVNTIFKFFPHLFREK